MIDGGGEPADNGRVFGERVPVSRVLSGGGPRNSIREPPE